MRTLASITSLALALVLLASGLAAQTDDASAGPERSSGTVTVLEIKGAIGPATSGYIEKSLDAAQESGAHLVVLEMDTPGGLDTSMRDIIRAILASSVPVASYVAPSGARAASAGTYIMYASHIAAMAPATNLGAATPVSIGGEQPPSQPVPAADDDGDDDEVAETGKSDSGAAAPEGAGGGEAKKSSGEEQKKPSSREKSRPPQGSTAMERKVVNDAVAYIRGLAELRGRNAEWAEDAVRGAASLSANAALSQNVIDLVARDLPDLLAQIDGREVKVANNTVTLATRGLTVERVEPDWRTKLLSVITNPTIAYGLLLIGIYGLLFEGYNPGAILPGVVGAIALITALFAFQILSVNYAGLALIALGVGMIIAEFFVPSFGALGLGGLVSFVVGSIILLDTDTPGLNISKPIIGGVAAVGGAVIVAIAWMARRSLNAPVANAMVGATGEALEDFTGKGQVRVGGELWNATCPSSLQKGQAVRVTKVDGLTLWVEPA